MQKERKKHNRTKFFMPRFILFLFGFIMFDSLTAAPKIEEIKALLYFDETPVSIKIADGIISDVTRIERAEYMRQQPVYVAPGLIDIQINGYAAVDFSGKDLTVAGIRKATKALWKEGVTTFVPTVITNSDARLRQNFTILAAALQDAKMNLSIPGFHLEGPYISPVDGFRGAHLKKWVRLPNWAEFSEYVKAAQHKILMVTVAPEIEGAMPFIEKCAMHGIIVALGHHNAPADVIKQAIDKGAVIATHLGNGCANMIQRHHNPLWPQLADDRLIPSLIVDGYHLTPEEVQVFYKVKGAQRIVLISDALDVAGLPPGEYQRGGRTVLVTPGVIKYPAQNVLAGAAAPISKDVATMMKFTKCSLADAINMACRNQARIFNLDDRGEIKPGKRADLILFTLEDGNLIIQKTILAGRVVYTKD